LGNAAAPGSIS